ncbi:class I SAM-dependent methyltransferase [Nostoc sp. 'Peltigera membranacea cyanobiont' N6]|uniref:class I SAM-dependent methyltransferase n=1 Tax=Nostoc sp. 'Peltigera membranacea cyanobiont' N6 TaxID=1261031 RepID=UPI000CF358E7|nr:class I SAM-dependent methyltransferase [Nostoc sp. 'Peltigera membranacea cyanobiont' N6]AVH64256.1 type 12 methyltransferase [Nostoc sp. 'Peltigera membranacea cyanobiont' N6]
MLQNKNIKAQNEQQHIESIASWYFKEQLDFDKQLIHFKYKTIKPYIQGTKGLKLGPGDGQMTQFLVQDFVDLTVVDGSEELLESIPNAPNLTKVHTLFEEFQPQNKFNTIVMSHILEHVAEAVALLQRVKHWLASEGKILTVVPNGHSIHRLAAVKMGLLKEPCELNSRDHALGHRRVYTPTTFRKDIEEAGLRIVEMGGVFFKPLSNQQIQDHWTEEMIQGFYELGKDFPEYAAEIYAVCAADD